MTKNNDVSEAEWAALTKAALGAMGKAYAPYSQFQVGAALTHLGQ